MAKNLLATGDEEASEYMGLDSLGTGGPARPRVWEEFVGQEGDAARGKAGTRSLPLFVQASPLDVNLKLFDVMGRIALHGLWLIWAEQPDRRPSQHPPTQKQGRNQSRRFIVAQPSYAPFVVANPALLTPIADEQVIDLSLGFMFLAAHGGPIRRPSRRGYPSS